MRILLVNPSDPNSLISFSGIADESDHTPVMPNLALLTLAAMTPGDIEVEIVDENIRPVDYDGDWDLVGISGYANHRDRMRAIADEFRRRGTLVAIGGPFVSLAPHELRDHADILFIGEAENTWPRFVADLRVGEWKTEYRESETVDIMSSPVPAYGYAPSGDYLVGLVQASRGCPFQCDFCDVIIYLGRKQRHKTPERVVDELEGAYQAGYREIFIADDNFTAYRKQATAIAGAIERWNRTKPSPVSWLTQLSIDVAADPELLAACARSGLIQAFVGIETPNLEALEASGKKQNLKRDMVTDVHEFYRHGIAVQGGMIVGFDADTLDTFRAQFEFLQAAAVPTITLNLLNAPYGTPLYARIEREGRFIESDVQFHDFATSIRPLNMTIDQLVYGARWLANKIYSPEAFLERLRLFASLLPDEQPRRSTDPEEVRRGLALWSGILKAHKRLGPEYRKVALTAMRLFKGKNRAILPTILLQYKHVVANLERRGALDLELARLPAPDFARAA